MQREGKPMKKADVDPMHVIVGAALVLLVFVTVTIIYVKYFGDQSRTMKCQVENLKLDCDGDGIVNTLDRCPCDRENKEGCEKKPLTDCFDTAKCECKEG